MATAFEDAGPCLFEVQVNWRGLASWRLVVHQSDPPAAADAPNDLHVRQRIASALLENRVAQSGCHAPSQCRIRKVRIHNFRCYAVAVLLKPEIFLELPGAANSA